MRINNNNNNVRGNTVFLKLASKLMDMLNQTIGIWECYYILQFKKNSNRGVTIHSVEYFSEIIPARGMRTRPKSFSDDELLGSVDGDFVMQECVRR